MLVDTHCHLQDVLFNDSLDRVIDDASKYYVEYMIVNGCDTITNNKSIELAERYSSIYSAIGYHPTEEEDLNLSYMEEALLHDKVVAIGEIGLDYYYTRENRDFQIEKFTKQLDLAVKYNKPVIIHNRNATDDLYHILKNYKGKIKGIIHCFSGSIETANMFIDLGFLLGIGGVLTFKNNDNLRQVIKNIPLEKIVLETDSPYLAPEPYRGKTNEPKYVLEIAKCVAKLHNISLKNVSTITTNNALNLFKIPRV